MSHYYYLGNSLNDVGIEDFIGSTICLDERESHHLINVCRTNVGDTIGLFGYNHRFLAEVTLIEKRAVHAKILEMLEENARKSIKIRCAIPVLKSGNSEFLIEKLTELGVDRIVIFTSKRTITSVIDNKKIERYKRIALEASKQSERVNLPTIMTADSPLNAIVNLETTKDTTFIAVERRNNSMLYSFALDGVTFTNPIGVLSGPEGGFSEDEIDSFSEKGNIVSLGQNILRAETAHLSMTIGALMHLGEM